MVSPPRNDPSRAAQKKQIPRPEGRGVRRRVLRCSYTISLAESRRKSKGKSGRPAAKPRFSAKAVFSRGKPPPEIDIPAFLG
jgi:hypothetical protein